MKKIANVLKRFDVILSGILIILLFLDIMLQVFNRATPNWMSIQWTVEMASILMCAALWIGLGQGVQNKSHIRFSMIVDTFPPKAKVVFEIIGDVVFLVFCIILAYHTGKMLIFYYDNNTVTTVLGWGKYLTKLPMLIGLAAALVRLIIVSLQTAKHIDELATSSQVGKES